MIKHGDQWLTYHKEKYREAGVDFPEESGSELSDECACGFRDNPYYDALTRRAQTIVFFLEKTRPLETEDAEEFVDV